MVKLTGVDCRLPMNDSAGGSGCMSLLACLDFSDYGERRIEKELSHFLVFV